MTVTQPFFPTGQYDENGNPYILAPYSVLNEPISNGVDVGGKEPMYINPCNLYSAIKYLISIYDAYKGKFSASEPTAVMSRTLNMLYERIEELVAQWSDEMEYTEDEMWRIYRFIRWLAIGVVNRFYRLKLVYVWGDFEETFDANDFTYHSSIGVEGASVKSVPPYGKVMEGHPVHHTITNKCWIDFIIPDHMVSTTMSFEMGHVVPERPDKLEGKFDWLEDFESKPYKITGDGWVVTLGNSTCRRKKF